MTDKITLEMFRETLRQLLSHSHFEPDLRIPVTKAQADYLRKNDVWSDTAFIEIPLTVGENNDRQEAAYTKRTP